jgi:DHA2 family multidrug resistance protein-like MFS transporter
LLLLLGRVLLPEFKDPSATRLDIPSVVLSLAATLAVIYGIKLVAQDGPGAIPLLSIVGGAAIASLFVMRQRSLADPLIDLGLFGVPAFSAAVGAQLVAAMSMGGIYLFVAQYLQLVLGLSPLNAGMWMLPSAIAGITGTSLAPYLAKRFRVAWVMCAGMLVAAAGIAVLTTVGSGSALAAIVASYMIIAFGFSVAMTLTTDMIMTVAPPERAGAASGISETSAELGLALGVALLGSAGTAWYRSRIDSEIPAGTPADAAENARSTLGGAVDAARELGDPLGTDLVTAARDAFGQSVEVVAAISALAVVGITVVVVLIMRSSRPPIQT